MSEYRHEAAPMSPAWAAGAREMPLVRPAGPRWREDAHLAGRLYAQGLPADASICSDSGDGHVWARTPGRALTPDEAREIGARLIEAAGRAEGYRLVATRRIPEVQLPDHDA